MSIRQKSTIQIAASEAARRHFRREKIRAENGGEYAKMKSKTDIRPLGEDWKHLKRELDYAKLSGPEETFFEEELEREYHKLKQQM